MSCDTAMAIRSFQDRPLHSRRGRVWHFGRAFARPAWISVGWVFLTILLQSCAAGPRLPEAWDGPLVIGWGRAAISYAELPEVGQWTSITTRGDGRATFVRSRYGDPSPVDLGRYFLRCRVRVDRTDRVAGLELRLSDTISFERHVAFRIPFFTDRSADRIHPGEWTAVSFGLGDAFFVGDPDLERLTYFGWFVMDSGEGEVIFDLTDVERIPRPQEGVVSFTFDDGYLDQLEAARVLSEYGLTATAYVMPRQIGDPGYLDAVHLTALADQYGWEISSHHAEPFTELSPQDLEAEVTYSFESLGGLGFSGSAVHLAYPLGKQNSPAVMDVVRNAYASARLASGGLETLPPADWHLLRAVNVLPSLSPQDVLSDVQRAQDNGEWAILMFHHLVESPRRDTDYAIADLKELVRLVAESGTQVMPVGQVWSLYGSPADEVAQARRGAAEPQR